MDALESDFEGTKSPPEKERLYPRFLQSDETSAAINGIRVTRLRPEDRKLVVSIIREILNPFEEAGSVIASAFRRLQHFERIYEDSSSRFLCVYHEHTHEVLGGAGLGPFAGLSPDDGIGEIRELFVLPNYRNLGLGRQLLHTCLEEAYRLNYTRIYLETTPEMLNAQRLFKSFGFAPVIEKLKNGKRVKATTALPCYFVLDQLGSK